MPRPSKAIRRQKVNAAIEYRKGNRGEAYKLWAKAADARKVRQAKRKAKSNAKSTEGGEASS